MISMMRKLNFLILGIFLLTACKFEEPVVFRMIDEVKIDSIQDGMVNLSARAVFFNPNEMQGKLKDIDLQVLMDDKTLATIRQAEVMKIAGKAEFSIPIRIRFAMEDVQQGLLNNLMNILQGNTLKLHFVGHIKVSSFLLTQKVEVDYYEKIRLQL